MARFVAPLFAALALSACGAAEENGSAPERAGNAGVTVALAPEPVVGPAVATVLERNGITLPVPKGWDGRILFRDAAGASDVMFQVANFELPANEGLEPPQELPPGQEDPIKAMGAGDVLIMVTSDEPAGGPAPPRLGLDDLRFLPSGTLSMPLGHARADDSFCHGARCFRVEVDFGGRSQSATLRAQVNGILASLQVEQAPAADVSAQDDGPRGCPHTNWPGPWTACAEADWVRRVVEAGGYRISGETGSALVAEAHRRSFYIWTTRAPLGARESGSWRRLATVAGVAVYGDDELWRFWEAQGFVFWVQEGPRGDSVVPSPAELRRVIEASSTIPPPPAN